MSLLNIQWFNQILKLVVGVISLTDLPTILSAVCLADCLADCVADRQAGIKEHKE